MASRLTRHLIWTKPDTQDTRDVVHGVKALTFRAVTASERRGAEPEEPVAIDVPSTARDRAIYLLHVGAEIEHALMVQYLYAGYSLDAAHVVDPEHRKLVQRWREVILSIAREEMGHLAVVENILTLIGGPLSFARQEFPSDDELYPFPFELEPLTKRSLGKYVLAESPSEKELAALGLTKEIDEIRRYVGSGGIGRVNRVGVIYDLILGLFTAPPGAKDPGAPPLFIHTGDIQADSEGFQVGSREWGVGYRDILILTASDRPTAIHAISQVAEQGEGSTVEDLDESHFGRFLEIYRAFPDESGWAPARNVARNPTLDHRAPAGRFISQKTAQLWAGLFNVRYRMLLAYLAHSFQVEEPVKASTRTPRGLLVSWAFGEMYNVRSISEILMRIPLQEGSEVFAGPPFELPYTLEIPPREADRWRTHRDLFEMSRSYIDLLLKDPAAEPYRAYLEGLRTAGESALEQTTTLIGG